MPAWSSRWVPRWFFNPIQPDSSTEAWCGPLLNAFHVPSLSPQELLGTASVRTSAPSAVIRSAFLLLWRPLKSPWSPCCCWRVALWYLDFCAHCILLAINVNSYWVLPFLRVLVFLALISSWLGLDSYEHCFDLTENGIWDRLKLCNIHIAAYDFILIFFWGGGRGLS